MTPPFELIGVRSQHDLFPFYEKAASEADHLPWEERQKVFAEYYTAFEPRWELVAGVLGIRRHESVIAAALRVLEEHREHPACVVASELALVSQGQDPTTQLRRAAKVARRLLRNGKLRGPPENDEAPQP